MAHHNANLLSSDISRRNPQDEYELIQKIGSGTYGDVYKPCGCSTSTSFSSECHVPFTNFGFGIWSSKRLGLDMTTKTELDLSVSYIFISKYFRQVHPHIIDEDNVRNELVHRFCI
uniref:Protein kinase domain-containing protein n=1 Tax=Glossina palpalis gambiensis TaxID=67801 RepID=A0A1B0AUV3_9MUSC